MEHNKVDSGLQATPALAKSSVAGSDNRLIEIFEAEIDKEIAEKMGAISEIADNIKQCQRSLDRLRKQVLVKCFMYSQQDMESEEQPSIHPAVQKLIGKRPRNVSQTEQFLTTNLNDWKRETRKNILKKCFKHKSKNNRNPKFDEPSCSNSLIEPRYIPPMIPGNPQENSSIRGNTKKMHMRVLVGNVAKPIESDGDIFDPATHKWMVYVRSAPGSLSIDRQVSRVHFFLHPSYKPHDIVTVPKPPFTLNRRGWGEFPMRVQLHFKNRLNKPADIIHHLKLNGAISGHHTRSAETFADIWLYPYDGRQNNVDLSGSENILSLASDMLKEEVPDFTSEVICNKCQTTSQGTDSNNCTCNMKISTQDSSPENSAYDSNTSSSEESDSSESEDSSGNSVLPKPISCWDVSLEDDEVEALEFLVKEELLSDNELNNSTAESIIEENMDSVYVKQENKKLDNEKYQESSNSSLQSQLSNSNNCEMEANLQPPTGANSTIPFNFSFSKAQSDILDIKASDIMDALEIKQEVKESEENLESFKQNIEQFDNDLCSSIPRDTRDPFVSLDSPSVSKIKHPTDVDLDQSKDRIIFQTSCEMNSTELILESSESKNNLPVLTDNDLQNTFLDCNNMIIEEVPIDDFINNIMEEEVVVEVPETNGSDVVSSKKSNVFTDISEIQDNTLQDTQLAIQKSSLCSAENSKEIMINKQTNSLLIKQKSITSQNKTCFITSGNNVVKQKNMAMKSPIPTVNHSLIAMPKYVTLKPLQVANNVTLKPMTPPEKGQSCLPMTRTVKLKVEDVKIPDKSPKFIQISKDVMVNHIHTSTNQVLKKQKIEKPNQGEQNILNKQPSLQMKYFHMNSVQVQPLGEKLKNDSKSMHLVQKPIKINQNTSQEISKTKSLLRPQYRSNPSLKNPRNPNSLLRPFLSKSITTQPNSITQQLFQKPIKQVLPSSNISTNSVIKSMVNTTTTLPNSTMKSSILNLPGIKLIKTTHNSSETLASMQQKITLQKSIKNTTPLKDNELLTTQNCNEPISTNKVTTSYNEVLKKTQEPTMLLTAGSKSLNEVHNYSKDSSFLMSNAPKSFKRQNNLFTSKPLIIYKKGNNETVQSQISKQNVGNQIHLNGLKVIVNTISFSELLKIIHFPKSSVPSRPYTINSGASEKTEVKTLDEECVLSCNSINNNLQDTYSTQPEFGRKSVMINKDHVNSVVSDQVLYYLEQLRLLVNTCMCAETEAAVRWLVRGLPLILADARLVAYRTVHPYCALSREAYCSWPSVKQAAAEWLRAKTVVRLLSALHARGVVTEAVWSTRKVYWWCRTHGYSPAFCLIGVENSGVSNSEWIQKLEQKTPPTKVLEWMATVSHNIRTKAEDKLDVVGSHSRGEPSKDKTAETSCRPTAGAGSLVCGRPWVQDMHSYVVSQVEQMGQEPLLAGGPPQSVATTLLSHATVALAEDLVRRGLANAALRGGGSVEPRDVCRAILRRPEFDIFTGQGLEVNETSRDYLKNLMLKPP